MDCLGPLQTAHLGARQGGERDQEEMTGQRLQVKWTGKHVCLYLIQGQDPIYYLHSVALI